MKYFQFEWDDQKNIKNQEKHGIRFEDAIVIFENDMLTEMIIPMIMEK